MFVRSVYLIRNALCANEVWDESTPAVVMLFVVHGEFVVES
jgi:hypothetical protein